MSKLQNSPRLRCFLIGENALALACAKILMRQGFTVLGVCSHHAPTRHWAYQQNIPLFDALAEFTATLTDTEYDLLFSIVNPHILPDATIASAKYMTINYHDAPLPRYAGVHATAHAILNGETVHGVTWHEMNEILDAGDILVQKSIAISPSETSETLNAKCFEAGLQSFNTLLGKLKNKRIKGRSQNSNERTFFQYKDVLPNNGFIHWGMPANVIDRHYRASIFGNAINRFGILKCRLGKVTYIVKELSSSARKAPTSKPGTLLSCNTKSLVVACKDGTIKINALADAQDNPVNLTSVIDKHKLEPKQILRNPSAKHIAKETSTFIEALPYEDVLEKRLLRASPISLKQLISLEPKLSNKGKAIRLSFRLPTKKRSLIIALFCAYLKKAVYHLEDALTLGYCGDKGIPSPFTVEIKEQTYSAFSNEISLEFKSLNALPCWPSDFIARHPALNRIPPFFKKLHFEVTIYDDGTQLKKHSHLAIRLKKDGGIELINIGLEISQSFLETMAKHVRTLYENTKDLTDTPLISIPYLSKKEQQSYQLAINEAGTSPTLPYRSIVDAFQTIVEQYPETIAIQTDSASLSYQALDILSNKFAHYLTSNGISQGDIVAYQFKRGIIEIVAILGILKCNTVYLPIDYNVPTARRENILADAKASLYLTDTGQKKTRLIRRLCINNLNKLLKEFPPEFSTSPSKPSDVCYIMYSSGTTGMPKGITIPHRGVIRLVHKTHFLDFYPGIRVLYSANPAFDASTIEIWGTLLNGGTLYPYPMSKYFDVEHFANFIETHPLDLVFFITSVFNAIARHYVPVLRGIKQMIIAAETLNPVYLALFKQNLKKAGIPFPKVVHAYGPTENTVITTTYQIPECALDVVSIGNPVSNTQVYLLDEALQVAPPYFPAELITTGLGLSNGYLGQKTLTKEKFIKIENEVGRLVRAYRTGDLAYQNEKGELYFIGRIDNQVKKNGYRIELNEIEKAVLTLPGIADGVVLADNSKNTTSIIAYYTALKPKKPPSMASLKSNLKKWVPDYMIPDNWVLLDAIPLTDNGKVDTQSILAISSKNTTSGHTVRRPIFRLAEKILNKRVQSSDDFFALGGDSMSAMEFAAAAQKRHIPLRVADIFKYPKLNDLDTYLDRNVIPIEGSSNSSLEVDTKPFNLSPIQTWFFERQFPNPTHFSQLCLLDLPSPITPDDLKGHLKALINMHDALRLRFLLNSDQVQQVAVPLTESNLDLFCLIKTTSISHYDENVESKYLNDLQKQFSLQSGPLMGLVLFTLPSGKQKLLWVIHHLLIDLVSWRVLLNQLSDRLSNRHPLMKSTRNSYQAWAKENIPPAESKLTRNPALANIDKESLYQSKSTERRLLLSRTMTNALIGASHDMNLPLHALMLTAIAHGISRQTEHNRLLVQIETHGRHAHQEKLDLTQTVGWFTQITSFDLHCPVNDLFSQLESTHIAMLNARDDYPVMQSPELTDVSINYWGNLDGFIEKNPHFSCDKIDAVISESNRLPTLIDVNAWVKSNQLEVRLSFNSLLKALPIKEIVNEIEDSLESITKMPKTAWNVAQTGFMLDIQRGILHHSQTSDSPIYNAQCVLEHQKLDVDKRKAAWNKLIKTHPLLRSRIRLSHPVMPVFEVAEQCAVKGDTLNWIDLPKKAKDEQLSKWLSKERRTPFNFESAPLFRVAFICLGKDQWKEVITFSHALLDGWSLMLLVKQCDQLYSGYKLVLPSSNSFKYAAWVKQQQSIQDRNFWKSYLCKAPHMQIPGLTNPASNGDASEMTARRLSLSKQETKRIQSFCKKHKITLNIFFQTIWATVLAQNTNQSDLVYGLTVSGRDENYPDAKNLIGMLSNVLPIRILKLDRNNFIKSMKLVQKNTQEILQRQTNSLYFVRQSINAAHETELFDSVFAFENYPVEKSIDTKIDIIDSAHYPLVFNVFPSAQITMVFNYHQNRISSERISRLENNIMMLINATFKSPESLPNLTPKTKALPKSHLSIKKDASLHEAFTKVASKYPDNLAVKDSLHSFSYKKLGECSNNVSNYLNDRGIKPGDKVAIHVARDAYLPIYILGILKCGASYVPLDIEAPAHRIYYILENCNANLLIADREYTPQTESLQIVNTADLKMRMNAGNSKVRVTKAPQELAYIIYTSGTTGNPKGVQVTHTNVLSLLKAAHQQFKLGHTDRWPLFHSPAFDYSVWEIFGCLLSGGTLLIPSTETTKDPENLYHWLKDEKATILNLTPSAFVNFSTVEMKHPANQLKLNTLILAGEKLDLHILTDWFRRYPDLPRITNMYGITETTVFCSYLHLSPDMLDLNQNNPIGLPLPGWELYVLDEHKQPVMPGEIGEIYVGGMGVTPGYIENERLTQERFIPNPFSENRNEKLYKSGDLARLNPDSTLDYQKRNDDQVKVRGYRIEPHEIEKALNDIPNIKQSKVVCKENPGGNVLLAYITTTEKNSEHSRSIRQELLKKLPHYMIPTHIIILPKFDLTLNGKIDTAVLPPPDTTINKITSKVETSDAVKKLMQVWSRVLQQNDIHLEDEFFQVGGNSFSAFHLITLINEAFDLQLSIKFIQDNPSLSEQALALSQVIPSEKSENPTLEASLVCLKSDGKKPPLFLIHPVGGSIFWFKNLAKYFDDDGPLYAIQDPGLQPPHNPIFVSVEEMAQAYIELIKTVAPSGPYYIGGASAGATTSIAIADILLSQGEKVNFIGLFDGWVPFPDGLKDRYYFEKNMQRQFHEMKQAFLAQGIQSPDEILALQWQRSQINAAYQVPKLKQKLTLFKASETIPVYQPIDAPYNYWETRTPIPVDLYNVPGNHESMFFEPNVKKLAKYLVDTLQKTENDLSLIAHKEETSYSES